MRFRCMPIWAKGGCGVCAILLAAATIIGVTACARLSGKLARHPSAHVGENAPGPFRLSPEGLQRELFQFVDRYRELVGQVTDAAVQRATGAGTRVLFQATKTSYVSAAISVVTGPHPLDALRDLIVMVTLQRMVWESGAAGQIPAADAQPLARVLSKLETQIDELAARVLPLDTIAKLHALIEKWRRANPDQHYVAYVRFQNLGDSADADEVNTIVASGGFLEPVEAVAREAHEARVLAERTLYLVNRMPMLVEWHSKLAYQQIAASPEAADVLENVNGYRAVLERLGDKISELPDQIAGERRALVKEFAQLVDNQRAQTLEHVQTLIRGEREALFASLSEGAHTYGPILGQLAATAAATRDALAALERMTAADASDPKDQDADDGQTLRQLYQIAERLATTASATNSAVTVLNALLRSDKQEIAAVDALLATQVRRVFLYAAGFVLLLVGIGLGVLGEQ